MLGLTCITEASLDLVLFFFFLFYVCFLVWCQGGHSFSSKEQASSNFMAADTICSDFGALPQKSPSVSIVSTSISHEVMGPDAMILFSE